METESLFAPRAQGRRTEPGSLTFCDLSMFYCEQGGGIRTYHRAKMDWFARQSRHRYVLVVPGPAFRETRLGEGVALVEVYGATTGHGVDGYRIPLDFGAMLRVLDRADADVVEVSDPWVTGPFALVARRAGRMRGLLTSFFHTDSLGAYVLPWLNRRRLPSGARKRLVDWSSRLFWRAQAMYDTTLVSSREMKRRLESTGMRRVVYAPFGLDPEFFKTPAKAATTGRPVRILYAARLQPEKGIDLVLETLHRFLDFPDVQLTIAGAGPYAGHVSALARPGVSFVGYVASRDDMRRLYRDHDVLLSPSPTETFGLTTLEAMASGLAVVGADAGGIGDLMRQARSPYTFRSGDRDDFLRAVRLAVEADRREPARRAREVAERHGTWADAVRRQVDLYVHLLTDTRVQDPSNMSPVLHPPVTPSLSHESAVEAR